MSVPPERPESPDTHFDPMNDPRPLKRKEALPDLDEAWQPKLKNKGGALTPAQRLNRQIYRRLLIALPVTGLTIILILLGSNRVDNPFGRWICRLRLGPNKIAYTVGLEDEARVWFGNVEGSVACPFINRQSALPSWSPDGNKIAFSSWVDNKPQIFVVNADGSDEHRLSNNTEGGADIPLWSPDGKKILFAAYPKSGDPHATMMDADGSNIHLLTSGQFVQGWSADGQKILFVAVTPADDGGGPNFELWAMDADGHNPVHLLHSNSADMSADWSADGKRIVFSSMRTGNLQIYLMDADGQNTKKAHR